MRLLKNAHPIGNSKIPPTKQTSDQCFQMRATEFPYLPFYRRILASIYEKSCYLGFSIVEKMWVTAGVLSLQASLSLAADLPNAVTPFEFPVPDITSVLLGRDLFFDPILSGNQNISCATCHHPSLGTGDAMSLSIGEGGSGLGSDRIVQEANQPQSRIPRNAPPLFNLGASEFTTLFHDGRVAHDPSAEFGIRMPDGFALDRPVSSFLAAQAILPITSPIEMAGQPGENLVADAVARGRIYGANGAWQLLAQRVEEIPQYRQRFTWLMGEYDPIHITDIGNAIADYIAFEFRATDSPFDAFLSGQDNALTNEQLRGMSLFFGKAKCSTCHSGTFQTDHSFHAIGIPQFGPGKGHDAGHSDHGRAAVTNDRSDSYKFRTPSLRNVTLTAPYGHNGAYPDLENMVRHHLDPMTMLAEFTIDRARLHDVQLDVSDTDALEDFDEFFRIGTAIEIEPVSLSEREIEALLRFLESLEDPTSKTGRLGVPKSVPSGLELDILSSDRLPPS